jgi:hypothetical protein
MNVLLWKDMGPIEIKQQEKNEKKRQPKSISIIMVEQRGFKLHPHVGENFSVRQMFHALLVAPTARPPSSTLPGGMASAPPPP